MQTSHGYLDAAATAPLRAEARTAMLDALEAGPGNASSVHSAGHRARRIVDHARTCVARSLGARESEVIFTSGGTEANSLAIVGLALANPRGKHIVTSAVEHSSVMESCRFLERVLGFEVSVLPVDTFGMVHPDDLEAVLRDDTTLLSVTLASGEVGTVQPVAALSARAKARGVIVHTDAVQAAAALPVSFADAAEAWPGSAVDAMTIASHKFGGPQGAGALLLRGSVRIEPIIHGGGQEGERRSGTENVAAIAGFGAAVSVAMRDVGSRAVALLRSRDEFIARVLSEVPGAALTGHPQERLPGHASFVVDGVSGESLLVALDAAGIAASSGSACAAGKDEPSPVLLAMGVEPLFAQTAIRFTLSEALSPELLERVVSVLNTEVTRARQRH